MSPATLKNVGVATARRSCRQSHRQDFARTGRSCAVAWQEMWPWGGSRAGAEEAGCPVYPDLVDEKQSLAPHHSAQLLLASLPRSHGSQFLATNPRIRNEFY
jgi:hypothetical protein